MIDLPFDLKVLILSFLQKDVLSVYAIKSLLSKDIVYATMIYKFPDTNIKIIRGIVNNYYNECYKCTNVLFGNYNIIMCNNCSPILENSSSYPIICQECSAIKLKRGEFKFTFCSICNKPTSHLGITHFS